MNISIIIPGFRSSRWLELCIASVTDHDSDDGRQDWLPRDRLGTAYIEQGKGRNGRSIRALFARACKTLMSIMS